MSKNSNGRPDHSGIAAILLILLMGLLLISGLHFLGDFFTSLFGS